MTQDAKQLIHLYKYIYEYQTLYQKTSLELHHKHVATHILTQIVSLLTFSIGLLGIGIELTAGNRDILSVTLTTLVVIGNTMMIILNAVNSTKEYQKNSKKHEFVYKRFSDVLNQIIELQAERYPKSKKEHMLMLRVVISNILGIAPPITDPPVLYLSEMDDDSFHLSMAPSPKNDLNYQTMKNAIIDTDE